MKTGTGLNIALNVPTPDITSHSALVASIAQVALTPDLSTHLAMLTSQLKTALAVSKTLQERQSATQSNHKGP